MITNKQKPNNGRAKSSAAARPELYEVTETESGEFEAVLPGLIDLETGFIVGTSNRRFKTKEEAELAYDTDYDEFINFGAKSKKAAVVPSLYEEEIVWDSISVDAACSGNPGIMGTRG